jgi:hypothetical protein
MVKYVKYLTHIATKSDNSIILLIILQNLSQPLENISGKWNVREPLGVRPLLFAFSLRENAKR